MGILAHGVALLSEGYYLDPMRTVTVKLPEDTLEKLKSEARATGRSVGALIRERIHSATDAGSIHALAGDLAGSVAGSRKAATNQRRRFRRS